MQEVTKKDIGDTGQIEFSPLAELQVVVGHPTDGESVQWSSEGCIARVKSQIRTFMLDIESNNEMQLVENFLIWPWLIEYAGQTLHMFQMKLADGLTPAKRDRAGKSTRLKAILKKESAVQNHEYEYDRD